MRKSILWLVPFFALCAFLFNNFAEAQTEQLVKRKGGLGPNVGILQTPASATWNLTAIESDADSCVFSSVFDLSAGTEDLPEVLLVKVSWAAAAGGSTTTAFGVTLFGHATSTATAGSNATQLDNRIPLGAWQVSANDTISINPKATASGEAVFFPILNASPYAAVTALPRYVSVAIQKEGNGVFTAGTVTVTLYPYQD